MKTLLISCLSISAVLFAQAQDANLKNQATRLAPSYFVANTASQKSDKRLIDDPRVNAPHADGEAGNWRDRSGHSERQSQVGPG